MADKWWLDSLPPFQSRRELAPNRETFITSFTLFSSRLNYFLLKKSQSKLVRRAKKKLKALRDPGKIDFRGADLGGGRFSMHFLRDASRGERSSRRIEAISREQWRR